MRLFILILITLPKYGFGCNANFEGFGVFLGSLTHLNSSGFQYLSQIIDSVYNDLLIRYYRTEILPSFSPSQDVYRISCIDTLTCSWISLHKNISKLNNIDFFASIWSPPHYMKDVLRRLNKEYEFAFYYFITNITQIIKSNFNITLDKISIDNEPENIFAPWEQCFMTPRQLCGLVERYNDPRLQYCTENSYFKVTRSYMSYSSRDISCKTACKTVVSHAYHLSLKPPNSFKAYYDTTPRPSFTSSPFWITEVSSTFTDAFEHQIQEAIDLATSIINFVGFTCVQRYYFWLIYSHDFFGESLIWLVDGNLYYPKKYYAFRYFTQAAFNSKQALLCSRSNYLCLRIGNQLIFVNNKYNSTTITTTCNLCCTTKDYDHYCTDKCNQLPPRSICGCALKSLSLKPCDSGFTSTKNQPRFPKS